MRGLRGGEPGYRLHEKQGKRNLAQNHKGHLPQRAGVALNERLNTQPEVFRHLGQIITSILNGDGDYFTCALSLHLSVELANGSR